MNLSVERVLIFALVICAFYYLNRVERVEGIKSCPSGCVAKKLYDDTVDGSINAYNKLVDESRDKMDMMAGEMAQEIQKLEDDLQKCQ